MVQDDEVGDGTTSVVVFACELLKVSQIAICRVMAHLFYFCANFMLKLGILKKFNWNYLATILFHLQFQWLISVWMR